MGYFDDMFGSDSDDFGAGDLRCKGITKAGKRCKISIESEYCSATILKHGYCTKHLSQKSKHLTDPNKRREPSYSTRHDFYRGDRVHPEVVQAARCGDLVEVRRILDEDPAALESFRRRREVVEKWGYDKEWTWNDDTALVAAAREGHAHVVAELLVRGANVHHRSCPEDDVHETAEGAAQRWQQGVLSYGYGPGKKFPTQQQARAALAKNARYACVVDMLRFAAANKMPKAAPALAPPQKPTAASLKVDALKGCLHRASAAGVQLDGKKIKLTGNKAELVARVDACGILEQEHAEAVAAFSLENAAAIAAADTVQARAADFGNQMRGMLASLKSEVEFTPEEVDGIWDRYSNASSSSGELGQKRALSNSLSSPSLLSGRAAKVQKTVKKTSSSSLKCGCGRRFINRGAIESHQRDSSTCRYSAKYRGR